MSTAQLQFEVYMDWSSDVMAAFRHPEDAAAFVAVAGNDTEVRVGSLVVWKEGETGEAGESYDEAAAYMLTILAEYENNVTFATEQPRHFYACYEVAQHEDHALPRAIVASGEECDRGRPCKVVRFEGDYYVVAEEEESESLI